jgi:hypothetical protein
MVKSSKALAKEWPYELYTKFKKKMQANATAYFREKSLPVSERYSYILPNKEMWRKNIICQEVADYVLASKEEAHQRNKTYPLHGYIHHGLSSQALLFNLVGPLIVRNDLEPLRLACETRDIPWPEGRVTALFEMEDKDVFSEQYLQPTSIDLVIRNEGEDGGLFVESKFTENEFGRCTVLVRGDCEGKNPAADPSSCYLHHIGRKYWTQMQEHGFLDGPLLTSPFCPLANYYQFFREVLFAVHYGGYFVLLHDERNPVFYSRSEGLPDRGIYPMMTALLPELLKERVKRITFQEVFAEVRKSPIHEDWVDEFARKYAM